MRYFKPKPGTKSAVHFLKTPFTDIVAFDAVIRSLVLANPLGCISYMSNRKNHLPVQIVREMFTARFAYLNAAGKQIGRGLDMYDSVGGVPDRHCCRYFQYGQHCITPWKGEASAGC